MIDKYIARGVEKELLISILGVRQEYLEVSFREMHDRYGDIKAYFSEGLGIDHTVQEALRAQFVERR